MAVTAVAAPEPAVGAVRSPLRSSENAVWATRPVADRLAVLTRARHLLAGRQEEVLSTLAHLPRTPADSLVAELLPLLAACEFLERNAAHILRTQRPPGRRPFWLAGVHSSVERVPLGRVLVIAPANYPLFLPGVQTLQAISAGNAVLWKPGRRGARAALLLARTLQEAGLPDGVLTVTDESVAAAEDALRTGVDQIVFTGSSQAGRSVLALAAKTATPVIAELSGCDAVFVLPGADPARIVDAVAFGMRLNGSATCMAPRRLMLIGLGHARLLDRLRERLQAMAPVALAPETLAQLRELVDEAAADGATVVGDLSADRVPPILVLDVQPTMRLAQADIFAPVLAVLAFPDAGSALQADAACPYGLTAAVFGPEQQAHTFARGLKVGTVLLNDLIVPTADPRVPFGGRRGSGFGVTRGAEGLLAMTAPRTVLVRHGRDTKHFQPTGEAHRKMFSAIIVATHVKGWRARLQGWRQVARAALDLRGKDTGTNAKNGSRA